MLAVDPGRVTNEGNYIDEMRSRSKRMLGSRKGFPEILMRPQQVRLSDKLNPAFFVMEELSCSLLDLCKNGNVWSPAEAAMVGRGLVKRFRVVHTRENSLGLVHNDVKPGNVMFSASLKSVYLVDFDCATAIPSVCPSAKGKQRRIQGSYQFSGIDMLAGDYRKKPLPSFLFFSFLILSLPLSLFLPL